MAETTQTDQSGGDSGRPQGCGGVVWVHPQVRFTPFPSTRADVGRGAACAIQLVGNRVSRRHSELRRDSGTVVLKDLGSKNGTFHNGRPVDEVPLCSQDVVRVGEWVGVVSEIDLQHRDAPVRELEPDVFGGSLLQRVFSDLLRVANSQLSVILVGETGVGKEVLAQALHRHSKRAGALVGVNCAALPEQMAEGELFGYRKGAFTTAVRSHVGYLRAAHQGTLLLDEVVDLDLRVQAKLLRVLEQRQVTPLGETTPESIDIRLVSAAQVPLSRAVEEGHFRADLYGRLNGVEIFIPPIRERREEILSLFRAAFRKHAAGRLPGFDPAAVERLCLHDWPMNVREVVQAAERAAAMYGHEPELQLEHLRLGSSDDSGRTPGRSSAPPLLEQALHSRAARRLVQNAQRDADEFERFQQALREVGGSVTAAARRVGISRQRAYRLMSQDSGGSGESREVGEG